MSLPFWSISGFYLRGILQPKHAEIIVFYDGCVYFYRIRAGLSCTPKQAEIIEFYEGFVRFYRIRAALILEPKHAEFIVFYVDFVEFYRIRAGLRVTLGGLF